MNHLLTITDDDFTQQPASVNREQYRYYKSSRAVVFNDNNEVALMKTGIYQIHKLPGGKIEPDETPEQAGVRECLEETGYDVKLTRPLGYIDEYKDALREHQRSYGFVARTIGNYRGQQLSTFEKDGKFELVWYPLSEAIAVLEHDQPIDYHGNFFRKRDLEFLRVVNTID